MAGIRVIRFPGGGLGTAGVGYLFEKIQNDIRVRLCRHTAAQARVNNTSTSFDRDIVAQVVRRIENRPSDISYLFAP